MKPMIAENRVTVNKKLFLEGAAALKTKAYKRVVLITLLVLAVLFGISAVWVVRQGGTIYYTVGEFLFIGFLILWIFVFMPRNKSAAQFRLMTRNNPDGVITRTTRFFETYLQATTETGKNLSISYRDIAAWRETKHLWVLVSKNHQAIMLGKDGFTQGSMDAIKKAAGVN